MSPRSRRVVKRLLVHRTLPEREVLALRIELDDKGKVTLERGEDRADEALRVLGEGVLTFQGKFVTPKDGQAYVDAVVEMLERTSMWHATLGTPDSAGPAR